MKLLMLCREPGLYSCRRLKAAAEISGHQMDILDPNRMLLKLSQKAPGFVLYYQPNAATEAYLLPHYDAVIPRFGTASTEMGCAVLSHLCMQGTACLNHAAAFRLARDKWQSLQLLRAAGVPIADTLLSGNEFDVGLIPAQIPSPCIIKTLCGSQGIGVMLAEGKQSTVSILETLRQNQIPALMQNFVTEAGGSDLRCFVIGNRVAAAMQRIGKRGEFRANFHRGGSAAKVQLSAENAAIALKAARTMELDIAGVDLIMSNRGALVLEVNASPGLELIEKTSGIDIARQMIAYLEKKVRG